MIKFIRKIFHKHKWKNLADSNCARHDCVCVCVKCGKGEKISYYPLGQCEVERYDLSSFIKCRTELYRTKRLGFSGNRIRNKKKRNSLERKIGTIIDEVY